MTLESDIDAILALEVGPDEPGAAIAVLRGGEFVHRKAYGLANLEWRLPLIPEGVFRIASLTKQFTATAIMMLAEQGRLSIDDAVQRHLPAWEPRDRTVTLRQLMNHTSGIRSYDADAPPRTERPDRTFADVLKLILAQPFASEPGERYSYNNSGYLMLGAIIEAVTGQRYGAALREMIFEPLGMTRTGLLERDAVTPLRVQGYVRGRKRFHNARPDALGWSQAAGGLGSTLDDLALWDRAIRDHRLIRRETLEAMLAPTRLNDGALFPYGFGWGTASYAGGRAFHHTGGVSGFGCHMLHMRDEALTTIVLSNRYLFPFDRVTRRLLRAAKGLDAPTAAGTPRTAEQTAAIQGFFESDGVVVEVGGGEAGFAPAADDDGWLVRQTERDLTMVQAGDPEVEFRFSDLAQGRYQRFEYVSPLWPVAIYTRRS